MKRFKRVYIEKGVFKRALRNQQNEEYGLINFKNKKNP